MKPTPVYGEIRAAGAVYCWRMLAFMTFPRNIFFRFLLLILASTILSGCGSSPDKTADHFMSLLVAGKHLEAQEMLSKDMRSMASMLGGVSNSSLNPYYRSGAFKSYTLRQIEKTDNSVRYKVVAITSDGTSHNDYIDLKREDGTWKISRF